MSHTTTVIEQQLPSTPKPATFDDGSLLGMLVVSLVAAKQGKKALRKLRRKFFWTSLKLKVKSYFKPRTSDRDTILYILLGIIIVVLIFLAPVAALVLALFGLVLYLAGVI